jgi:hypothetical protein
MTTDAPPGRRCVRLALANPRVGQVWGEAISIRNRARKGSSGMGRLAGPNIPRLVCRQGPPDFESGLAT